MENAGNEDSSQNGDECISQFELLMEKVETAYGALEFIDSSRPKIIMRQRLN